MTNVPTYFDGATVFDETCDVWDSRGQLVATGHQLAGLRLPRP